MRWKNQKRKSHIILKDVSTRVDVILHDGRSQCRGGVLVRVNGACAVPLP